MSLFDRICLWLFIAGGAVRAYQGYTEIALLALAFSYLIVIESKINALKGGEG